MISFSSSLASSTPATSLNVIFFCCMESNRARLLPKLIALLPPDCIWRSRKNHRPSNSANGASEISIDSHWFEFWSLLVTLTPWSMKVWYIVGSAPAGPMVVRNWSLLVNDPVSVVPSMVTDFTWPGFALLTTSAAIWTLTRRAEDIKQNWDRGDQPPDSVSSSIGLSARWRLEHVREERRSCRSRRRRMRAGCRYRGPARRGSAQDGGLAERNFQQRQLLQYCHRREGCHSIIQRRRRAHARLCGRRSVEQDYSGRYFRSAGSHRARQGVEPGTGNQDCSGLRGTGVQGLARD